MAKRDGQNDLINEVLNRKKDLSVTKISYPFGTLRDLYDKGKLIINPKFQRFFRRDKVQKSNFIESILLGLPIPPIFVSKKGATWELIDGLQRLSTIFEFLGSLKDTGSISSKKSISKGLLGTGYLPSLNGITYDDIPDNLRFELEWNYNIDVIILEDSGSTNEAKYELFYRLNTGGSSLSNQEVRSAIMIMENEILYDCFDKLRKINFFEESIFISEKDEERQQDLELVLRFFAIKNFDKQDGKILSTKSYLDHKASKFLKNFDIKKESIIFLDVFKFLNDNFDSSPFREFNKEKNTFKGRMNISAYDIISSGLGYSIENGYIDIKKDKNFLIGKIKELFSCEEFTESTKVGITSEGKMKFSIKFGREYFKKI